MPDGAASCQQVPLLENMPTSRQRSALELLSFLESWKHKNSKYETRYSLRDIQKPHSIIKTSYKKRYFRLAIPRCAKR